jgi:hypothetical protein
MRASVNLGVKRLAVAGLLLTMAACAAFSCSKTPPAPVEAGTWDAAAGNAEPEAATSPPSSLAFTPTSPPPIGSTCVVDTDRLKAAMLMAAHGGTGTGLAQDATVQAIIALYGASIPQGGTGTGLCQDASLQALYLLIAAQLDGGGSSSGGGGSVVQLDGNVIGPSNNNQVVEVQNQAVSAGSASGQVWIFNGTAWVPGFVASIIDAGTITLAGGAAGPANNNILVLDAGAANVTGILPAQNMTPNTGDIFCTAAGVCTVIRLQTVPVSDAGPLSGQSFIYNGTAWTPTFASVDAGSIALAGDTTGPANANTNVAVRGQTVLAGDASTEVWIFNGTSWIPGVLGGDINCNASGNCLVEGISGATPIPITPNVLQFSAATTTPTISQQTSTTGNGVAMLYQTQGPLAAGTNTPGDFHFNTPAPNGAGVPGASVCQGGGANYVQIGELSNGSTAGAIWGPVARSGTNEGIEFNAAGTITTINSTANGVLAVSNATKVQWGTNTLNLAVTLGGQSTTSFQWTDTAATIACGTGGTQTVTAAQAVTPGLIVTSGTLSSNCTLDFGTNATNGWFQLDMSGVTLGATFGVIFKNGTASSTTFLSTNVLAGGTLATVWTHGTNTLATSY